MARQVAATLTTVGPRRQTVLVAAAALAVALGAAAAGATPAARADTVTLPPGVGLPWSDPQHQSPLEQLAAPIATRIAGRPVTVRCEGDTDWLKLTKERSVDPRTELGYVGVEIFSRGGVITSVVTASFTELSPGTCAGLQAYALADPKPTTCQPPVTVTTTVLRPVRVATRVKVDLGPDPKHPGKRRTVTRTVWKVRQVPASVSRSEPGPSVPCYTGGLTGSSPRFAMEQPSGYQHGYQNTTEAILTLAHEAIHLGGTVGGTTTSGLLYGDQQAEARAECSGLQWLPYVAQQLGGSAADGLAMAQFYLALLYPQRKAPGGHPEYWSADCVPGGALDIRTDRAAPWPSGLG